MTATIYPCAPLTPAPRLAAPPVPALLLPLPWAWMAGTAMAVGITWMTLAWLASAKIERTTR